MFQGKLLSIRLLRNFSYHTFFLDSDNSEVLYPPSFKMALFNTLHGDIFSKIFPTGKFEIDTYVSKLHYKVTVLVLVSFSVLLSISQVSHF